MKSFFRGLGRVLGGLLSFLIAILLALMVMFAAGWTFKVVFGGETSSQYLRRYADFYRHPEQTEFGAWVKRALERIQS